VIVRKTQPAGDRQPLHRYAVAITTSSRPFTYTVVARDESDAVVLAVESHVHARRPGIVHTDVRRMGVVLPDVDASSSAP
jgi:hypothetical protein